MKSSQLNALPMILPTGFVEVYFGAMWAGKGEKLVDIVTSYMPYSNNDVLVFKPDADNRNPGILHSRAYPSLAPSAITISSANSYELFNYLSSETRVVVIDEAQLFNNSIVGAVNELRRQGKHVILAGLDRDFRAEPFGSMYELLSLADYTEQLYAKCGHEFTDGSGVHICGSKATLTQRLENGEPANYNSPIVVIGDRFTTCGDVKITYFPVCDKHYRINRS